MTDQLKHTSEFFSLPSFVVTKCNKCGRIVKKVWPFSSPRFWSCDTCDAWVSNVRQEPIDYFTPGGVS